MAIGNGLGSIFLDGLLKLQNYLRPKENEIESKNDSNINS